MVGKKKKEGKFGVETEKSVMLFMLAFVFKKCKSSWGPIWEFAETTFYLVGPC